MFNLFNIFKKKENTEEEIKGQEEAQESDIRASITYFIREDGSPYVDISIVKTNEENINLLSDLLIGVASNHYLDDTVDMVRDYLLENDEAILFIKMAEKLARHSSMIRHEEEEPCIKPSEAM
tara:strand:+ start:135 stop:503 length:369 start_codon:yes stop_codon:yes gene_type:complete